MISNKTIIVNKTESQLIINALKFLANNIDFKTSHEITEDELESIASKINQQINPRITLSKPQGIFETHSGWR